MEAFFKAADLREAFRSVVLFGDKIKPPTNEDLEALANKLNQLRHFVRLRRNYWEEADRKRELIDGANKVILENCLHLISETRRSLDIFRGVSPLEDELEGDLSTLESLYLAARIAHEREGLFRLITTRVAPIADKWYEYAELLLTFFRDALTRANPGTTIGVSNGGPAARFISHVLPDISGDSIRPDTVSDRLKSVANVNRGKAKT